MRLDRLRNSTRTRRRNLGQPDPHHQPSGLDPLALLQREHYERTRPLQIAPPTDPRTDSHPDDEWEED